jgi:hypothetical protein
MSHGVPAKQPGAQPGTVSRARVTSPGRRKRPPAAVEASVPSRPNRLAGRAWRPISGGSA